MHTQNNFDILFFQILDQDRVKRSRKKEIREIALNFDELNIEKHCWSRTEVASIRGLSQVYRDEKKPEIAILILRKTIESFDKETIGQENACLGKTAIMGDIGNLSGRCREI